MTNNKDATDPVAAQTRDQGRGDRILTNNKDATDPVAAGPFDLHLCPWCGGPADIEEIGGKDGAPVSFSVGCHDGDGKAVCFGYQSLTSFARKSDAVAAWNRRAVDPSYHAMKEALEGIASGEGFPYISADEKLDAIRQYARAALGNQVKT